MYHNFGKHMANYKNLGKKFSSWYKNWNF